MDDLFVWFAFAALTLAFAAPILFRFPFRNR
jgi:hypothetical protein